MQHLHHLLLYHPICCIYFPLVHSYTSYCAITYANTFKTHLHPLQVLQNKAMQTLMSYPPAPLSIPDLSSTKSAYKYLNILPITLLIPFNTVLFAVKCNENLLPSLLHMFDLLPLESTHPYSTRQNLLIHQSLFRCKWSWFSLRYGLIVNYNKYKNNIKVVSKEYKEHI